MEVFAEAVALNDTSTTALFGVASTLFQMGSEHNNDTLAAVQLLLAVDAHHSWAHALAGVLEAEGGRVESAVQRLNAAVALDGTSALFRLATCVRLASPSILLLPNCRPFMMSSNS